MTTVPNFYKCTSCCRERKYDAPPTECRFCGEPVQAMAVADIPLPKVDRRERSNRILRFHPTKKYALAVSKAKRAGMFTRFSKEFYLACESEMEGKIAALAGAGNPLHSEDMNFTSPYGRKRLAEKLNRLAQVVIHGKVMRHPSVGKTLKD